MLEHLPFSAKIKGCNLVPQNLILSSLFVVLKISIELLSAYLMLVI